MTRLRIDLAYDGGGFYGWAKQPNLRTVQGTIEDALHKVLRVPADDAAEPLRLTVAGTHRHRCARLPPSGASGCIR